MKRFKVPVGRHVVTLRAVSPKAAHSAVTELASMLSIRRSADLGDLISSAKLPRLEREWKHILANALASGKDLDEAERVASATVNRDRAARSKAGGTKLVRDGGSRRQWYPSKATHSKSRAS